MWLFKMDEYKELILIELHVLEIVLTEVSSENDKKDMRIS
jgi:hypothetical protein